MAKDETVSPGADSLKADADALAAIGRMADYTPANAQYTLDKLEAASKALTDADKAFSQAEADWQTARDTHIKTQWAFHNKMLGAKQQVVAQYGDDSNQAQGVGLTKKSERSKPTRKAAATTAAKAA